MDRNVFTGVKFFPIPYTGGFRDGPSDFAMTFLWFDKKKDDLYVTNNKNIFNLKTQEKIFKHDFRDSVYLAYFFFDDRNKDILYYIRTNGFPEQDSMWYKLTIMDTRDHSVINEKLLGKYWYKDVLKNYMPWVAYRKDTFVLIKLIAGDLHFEIYKRGE